MDRPAAQVTLVSYLITFSPLLFTWSNTGFSGVTVHLAEVEALALPATASGIARAAIPVRASTALRENDMGNSIHIRAGACRRPSNRTYASTRQPVLGAVAGSAYARPWAGSKMARRQPVPQVRSRKLLDHSPDARVRRPRAAHDRPAGGGAEKSRH